MRHTIANRILAVLLSVATALSTCMPATVALAESRDVQLQNHWQADGRTTVSGVLIGDVRAPRAGEALDDTARVEAEPNAAWDIPVLWVSNDLALATKADEGKTYLPVLAFYVPQDYALADDTCTVGLSESLAELFGGNQIISVYNAATGITYIMPAAARSLFAAATSSERQADESAVETSDSESPSVAGEEPVPNTESPDKARSREGKRDDAKQGEEKQDEGKQDEAPVPPQKPSLIDIYCGQSARDALTDEDLEWLIDIIINTIEPQAVNYLVNKFPAFGAAAQNGEIGKQIGLYIYYNKGDKDGVREHETAPQGALAYVSGHAVEHDGEYKFSYMIGVNIDDLLIRDLNGDPVRDEDTGKFNLVRVGESMHTFENTMIHELFHAFMDDYNRTGMLGVTKIGDYVFDSNGELISDAQRYYKLHLPTWFIEGTASAVENVFQLRFECFDALRMGPDGKPGESFTPSTLVGCYLNGTYDGKPAYFDLANCNASVKDNGVGNAMSAYVCGYLATVYLANLASIRDTGSSAIILKDGNVDDVSTDRLRMGLNSILERMHKGESLDQIIADIAPTDASGKKLYADTADFQNKFIKGTPTTLPGDILEWELEGDKSSSAFVADYLNYLTYVSNLPDRNYKANGSILLPVDADTGSPLDYTKSASSEYYKVVESNREVPSTVPDSAAFASGGKSDPNGPATTSSAEPVEPPVQAANAPAGPPVQATAAPAEPPALQESEPKADEAEANGTARDDGAGTEETPEPTEEAIPAPSEATEEQPSNGQPSDSAN